MLAYEERVMRLLSLSSNEILIQITCFQYLVSVHNNLKHVNIRLGLGYHVLQNFQWLLLKNILVKKNIGRLVAMHSKSARIKVVDG